MNRVNDGWELITRNLCDIISDSLDKVGIHYRLFSRIKDDNSLLKKIELKRSEGIYYTPEGKRIQDFIGIRVITYFQDDISLVREILEKKFKLIDDSSIDDLALTEFRPKRTNIIYSIGQDNISYFDEIINTGSKEYLTIIDKTFELQLRTILSEGWHEIEHSLRYKCKKDWESFDEKSRMLNGIYATLETSDTTLKTLFNELAYSHFKAKNWSGLIRTKFRLRFKTDPINDELSKILDKNLAIGKKIVKIDREQFLSYVSESKLSLPLNINSLIFYLNKYELKDSEIDKLTPSIYDELNESVEAQDL